MDPIASDQRRSVEFFSRLPDDQALTRSFHNGFGHLPQRVDFENSLHLGEEPIQQAKVPARNSDDGRHGIFSPRLRASSAAPTAGGPRSYPMGETHARIQFASRTADNAPAASPVRECRSESTQFAPRRKSPGLVDRPVTGQFMRPYITRKPTGLL